MKKLNKLIAKDQAPMADAVSSLSDQPRQGKPAPKPVAPNLNHKAGEQVPIPESLKGRVLRARRSRTGGIIYTMGTPIEEDTK